MAAKFEPSPESFHALFTHADARWLSKNGIDYREAELLALLREERDQA